jgi:hypothetical protein
MIGRIGTYVGRHHVALLALFVALGGTSYAASAALVPKNSVGSAQVINGSLQKGDLSKKAVVALKGAQGQQGAQGAQGATGSAGAAGAVGATGPPGISGYVVVTTTTPLANGAFAGLSAPCPAGKKVLGGGLEIGNFVKILGSLPLPDGTGWRIDARNDSGVDINMQAFAVCAFVS